jgi:hypothetical protein
MHTLFFFGAGASYGSDEPTVTPPLGKDLYDRLCEFSPDIARHTEPFADAFRKNFEEGMSAFAMKHGWFTPYMAKIMAGYLFNFSPRPRNLYIELLRAAAGFGHRYTFATLNYDLMLELSASALGIPFIYGDENDDGITGYFRLIKPHGSCNLIPRVGGGFLHDNRFEEFPTGFDWPVKFSYDMEEVAGFLSDMTCQDAPGVCFITPGKPTMFGEETISRHYQMFDFLTKKVDQVVVIGVAHYLVDEHIWGSLAAAPGSVIYFDPFPANFDAWAKIERKGPTRSFATDFRGALEILKQFGFDLRPSVPKSEGGP